MAQKRNQAPFKASGTALWNAVTEVLILDGPHEELLLREICRAADQLDDLQAAVDRDGVMLDSSQGQRAHPALVELRQARLTFARLVSALGLPQGLVKKNRNPSGVRGVYAVKAAGQ